MDIKGDTLLGDGYFTPAKGQDGLDWAYQQMSEKAGDVREHCMHLLAGSERPYVHVDSGPLEDWQGGGFYRSEISIVQEGRTMVLERVVDEVGADGGSKGHTAYQITFDLDSNNFTFVGDLGDGQGQRDLLVALDPKVGELENDWRYPGLLMLNALADFVKDLPKK